jgi:HEAT repeat protein
VEKILQLIKQIDTDDQTAENAVVQLVSIGMPSVPAVINAIRAHPGSTWRLCEVLRQIHHPDIVPILIELLQEEDTDLVITAFQALGQSKDQRALQPLLDALSGLSESMATKALGELGNPQAVEGLLKVAQEILNKPHVSQAIEGKLDIDEEDFDDSPLRFLPEVIIALAKLGNYEMAHIVIPLTRYQSEDVYSDAEIIRTNATKALQYVVLPGMFPALQAALHDDYNEVRLQAVDAVFYLGIKEAIGELIACVQDESSVVVNNVLVRLHDLTGTWFKDDVQTDELQEWWKQQQTNYEGGVCYRLGKPLHLPDVIALLEEPNQRKPIIQELKIIAGVDFSLNVRFESQGQDELVQRALQWWQQEGHRFEDGCLYKYGYKQDIKNIF